MTLDTFKLNIEEIKHPAYTEVFEDFEEEVNPEYTQIVVSIEINEHPYRFAVSEYDLFNHNAAQGKKLLQKEYSDFEPFTCSCGISGCAGIFGGIYYKFRGKTIEWRIPDNMGYGFLDKKFYKFDKKQYFSEIVKLWDYLEARCDDKHSLSESDYCWKSLTEVMTWWKHQRKHLAGNVKYMRSYL
jgi:hypothetical protein